MTGDQVVIFALGSEEYGVEIRYAQEILRIPEIVKIPDSPAYVEGIINLRRKIIPVIDLKRKFGLGDSQTHADSRLVVLNIEGLILGIIVDDVSEVVKLEQNSIERLPAEFGGGNDNCLKGVGRIENRLLLLLDVKKSFTDYLLNQTEESR